MTNIDYYILLDLNYFASEYTIINRIEEEKQRFVEDENYAIKKPDNYFELLLDAERILGDEFERTVYDENLFQNLDNNQRAKYLREKKQNDFEERINFLLKRYNHYYQEDNWPEVKAVTLELIALDNKNAEYWEFLSNAQHELKEFSDARFSIKHAIDCDPTDSDLYYHAYFIYRDSFDLSEEERYEKSGQYIMNKILDPSWNMLHRAARADWNNKGGNYEEVIRELIDYYIFDQDLYHNRTHAKDAYAQQLLRAYRGIITHEYMDEITNGTLDKETAFPNHVFTNKHNIEMALTDLTWDVRKNSYFGIEDEVNAMIEEVEANKKIVYQYKKLFILSLSLIWFWESMKAMNIIPLILSGSIFYYNWNIFRVPQYVVNRKLVKKKKGKKKSKSKIINFIKEIFAETF